MMGEGREWETRKRGRKVVDGTGRKWRGRGEMGEGGEGYEYLRRHMRT